MNNANLIGMAWMVMASAIFAVNFTIIRILSADFHVFELVFFRNLFGFVFILPFLIRAGRDSLIPKRPGLMGLRGVLQTFALMFWYYALIVAPFATATSLSLLEPIFASVIAILFLREKSTPARWVVVGLGLAGSLIIIRPGFESLSVGALSALASAVFWAGFLIIGKVQTRYDSIVAIVAYPTLIVVPLALIPAMFVWKWPEPEHWLLLCATGILASTANIAFTKAYKSGDVTAISPISFVRLIFAAIVGYFFFSEIPEIWVWVGGAIIVAAGSYLVRMEANAARKIDADQP
ncbi:MAG: DMT family transporter [Rhodospirillales bacterium]|nr:DMT family transporter [Rhodospirillales bacterium]